MADDGEREDRTLLRPPTGIRRPRPATETTVFNPAPSSNGRGKREGAAAPPATTIEFYSSGRNPILSAAATVLVLGSRLESSVVRADLANLRRQAGEELERFKSRCRSAGVAATTIESASYILCTYFDTAVMRAAWGTRGEWGKYSLLVAFHREAFGGETFFGMGESAMADSQRSIDLLELLYVCLALGFEGRYRGVPDGREKIEEFKLRLYRKIKEHRGDVPRELSERWTGVDAALRSGRSLPVWGAGLVAILLAFLLWAGFRQMLSERAEPILSILSTPVVIPTQMAYAQPSVRIRPFLAEQERAGEITVEEDGDRTTIVLNSSALFATGSADVSQEVLPTVSAIAKAIGQAPGRVLIVGHTDDVPVRSFEYSDNFALSRARAESVRRAIAAALREPAQLDISGAGSSQPRFLPAESAENRAKNRRVELIHYSGATQDG